jgi:hypothetical protein
VLRGEAKVTTAAQAALQALLNYVGRALRTGHYDVAVLDAQSAGWSALVDAELLPPIEDVFNTAWAAAARAEVNPAAYATRHLESVHNRLVGKADEVFDLVRLELEAGRQLGEGIPALAARLDGLLSDGERWASDARTIARTEVIGAVNMGKLGSAHASAAVLGVDVSQVVKEWVATNDGRTRPTHSEAQGATVVGLDATFSVGDSELDAPGDPFGDPGEVINCRCTVLFHYPGDPGYEALAASAASTNQEATMTTPSLRAAAEEDDGEQTGVIVCALPAADDPCQAIGPEQKHSTLLYFGDVPGGDNPNELLTPEFLALLTQVCTTVAAATGRSPRR